MPVNFMWFILGDGAGKQKFTSLGVEPNTNSTRRAGLLAAVAGPVGLIVGVRDAQKDAEAAAAAVQAAPPTRVPDVKGATLDDATTRIKAAGLKLRGTSTEPSAPDDKDKVTRTDPVAGSAFPTDLFVTIVLGTGIPPAPAKVPDVKGATSGEATTRLEAVGLTISAISTEPSAPDDKDKVTRTDPVAGSDLPADLNIKIFLGTGTPATVPDVKGATSSEATRRIEASGGKVKETLTEPSAAADKDKVTRTEPPAGSPLPADLNITIFLGTGKS